MGGALWEKIFLDFEILFFLDKTLRKSFFVFKRRNIYYNITHQVIDKVVNALRDIPAAAQ